MPIVNRIKRNFPSAVVGSCSEMGCKLRLNGLSNYVVLKGERICGSRRICDCIIFTRDNGIIIGIVELKGKTTHSTKIIEKLTNGSEIALDILKEHADKQTKIEFYHLVLSKSWYSSEYRTITSRKITVRGKRYDIIPKRCGISFRELISNLK